MSWSYSFNPESQITELVYRGSTTARDLQESTTELIDKEKTDGWNRFLVDATAMELDATLHDVYDLPARQYPAQGADRAARLAVLLPTSYFEREAAEFYRDACQNRGLLVETFADRAAAMAWLQDTTAEA